MGRAVKKLFHLMIDLSELIVLHLKAIFGMLLFRNIEHCPVDKSCPVQRNFLIAVYECINKASINLLKDYFLPFNLLVACEPGLNAVELRLVFKKCINSELTDLLLSL